MNISESFHKKLQSFIKIKDKSPDKHELEVRFFNIVKNNNKDIYEYHISEDKFIKTIQRLTFASENGGNGLKYEIDITLEVLSSEDNIKYVLTGESNVEKSWIHNSLDFEDANGTFIYKNRKEIIDLNEYGIRLALNEEETIDPNSKSANNVKQHSLDIEIEKTYRYKKRYMIYSDDGLMRFDLTMIKMSKGRSIKESKVFKSIPIYEIEIEYIGNKKIDSKKSDKDVSLSILNNIHMIMMYINDSDSIIGQNEKNGVIEDYLELVSKKNNKNNLNRGIEAYENDSKLRFIVANPVTLHRKNLISNRKEINIVDKLYAVTPKADGVRNLLFINYTGNLYRIDVNFNVFKIDMNIKSWKNSLIEGEYLDDLDIFMAYDILFAQGEDIRKRILIRTKSERSSGQKSRHEYLNEFISTKEVKANNNNDNASFKLEMKQFMYNNGESKDAIFNISKKMWESRMSYPYEVDGLIYIPIKEHYPVKVGAWTSLFKWKPSELNSIDFLIKVEKDENGADLVGSILVNGTSIKYKTVLLYVGSQEDRYDKNKKAYKRNTVPILFSPYQLDDENNNVNRARIPLNSHGKMIAADPVHHIYQEMSNDIIAEFIYDSSDFAFPWKPLRVRYDKTMNYKNGKPVYGNNKKTANDIWENIHNPIKDEMIFEGLISNSNLRDTKTSGVPTMQTPNSLSDPTNTPENGIPLFIHYVKQHLHNKYGEMTEERPKYMEFGSSKGDDYSLWQAAGYDTIIGLDNDKLSVDLAITIYKSLPKPKPKVFHIWSDITRLIFPNHDAGLDEASAKRLDEFIKSKNQFNIIGSFFVLSEIYANELNMKIFVQNIADNIIQDGHVIIISMDGETIFNELEGKKSITNDTWQLEKKYRINKWSSDAHMTGKKYMVNILDKDMKREQYLVNFNYVENIFTEYGFEKQEDTFMNSYYNNLQHDIELNEDEMKYISLFRIQIYKKTNQTSDKLRMDLTKRAARRTKH